VNRIVGGTMIEESGHEGLGQDLAPRLLGTVALVAIIDMVTRSVD